MNFVQSYALNRLDRTAWNSERFDVLLARLKEKFAEDFGNDLPSFKEPCTSLSLVSSCSENIRQSIQVIILVFSCHKPQYTILKISTMIDVIYQNQHTTPYQNCHHTQHDTSYIIYHTFLGLPQRKWGMMYLILPCLLQHARHIITIIWATNWPENCNHWSISQSTKILRSCWS